MVSDSLEGQRVVFTEASSIAVERTKVDWPGPNEVLIKTVSTLISTGTELARLTGNHIGMKDPTVGFPKPPFYPFEPGYSNAGVVMAKGCDVTTLGVGDKVFSSSGHRSHVTCSADPNSVQAIPESVTFDEATMVRLGAAGFLATQRAAIVLGETVVVIGLGLVGLLTAQMAKVAGAGHLVAVDVDESRLELASKLCADVIINPTKVDTVQMVKEMTGGRGAPVVMDVTGSARVFPTAVKLAAPYGRVMLVGCSHQPINMSLYPEIFFRALTVIGCCAKHIPTSVIPQYPWTRSVVHQTVLDMLEKKDVPVEPMITDRFGYKEAPAVYESLAENPGRSLGVILDWTES